VARPPELRAPELIRQGHGGLSLLGERLEQPLNLFVAVALNRDGEVIPHSEVPPRHAIGGHEQNLPVFGHASVHQPVLRFGRHIGHVGEGFANHGF
jgi:hypothetical protein